MRALILLALLLSAGAAYAEPILRTHRLGYQTAEALLPLLRPQLRPGETLSGQRDLLVLRAEPARQQEISALIQDLDRPPRSLLLSVRTSERADQSRQGGEASVGTGGAGVRVYSSRDAARGGSEQQVRVLEGRPAFINAGVAIPVTDHAVVVGREQTGVAEQTRWLHLDQGFSALARVHGERVEIEIVARQAGAQSSTPAVTRHEVLTQASGRLGEWILIGASGESDRRSGRGLVHRSEDARRETRQVWLKVELLP